MPLSPIVKALKDEMERRGLNAVELSKLADVGQATIYEIMRGEANPTIETVEKLAKALKMKVTAA